MTKQNPVLSLLGFSRKAGKLAIGFLKTKESLLKGKSFVVIVCSDVSPKTAKEVNFFAKDTPVIMMTETIYELSEAIGVKAGVVSVDDPNFADGILNHSRRTNNAD